MAQTKQDVLRQARETFVSHLKHLRNSAGLSQMALQRETEREGIKVSQGTISDIESDSADSGFSNYAALAAHFGVPLWLMLIPGLDTDLLEGDRLKRFRKLVEDYVACDDTTRVHIENLAAAHASLKPKK